MMHYVSYFDICAIFILLFFLLSLILKRKVAGRNNYLMFSMLLLAMISSFADLGFVLAHNSSANDNAIRICMYVCLSIYFLSRNLILPVYVFFIYTSIGVWHMFQRKRYLLAAWSILTLFTTLPVLINPFSPVVFSIGPDKYNHAGILIYLFHLIAITFAVWGILALIHYRKTVKLDKMLILSILYPIVVAAVLIQLNSPMIRIEMFGISIAMMTFMIAIQSSENLVDPLVGAKKYSAGIDHLLNIIHTHKPSTILLIKIVNDANILMYLGQDIHDLYLKMLSSEFKKAAKQHHYGAELYYLEYGLYGFLSEADELESAYEAAEAIRQYLTLQHQVSDFDVLADARFCIIQNPDDFDDFQSMFDFATSFQKTLPPTKKIMLYADYKDQTEFRIRSNLDEILSDAISNKRYEMYYQPIYSTVEKQFVSAEALIRLNDEKYGFISPSLFIPHAETTGTIHAIGDWVLNDVFRFMSENNLYRLGLKYFEINLSASQCIEPDLVDRIEHLIDQYSLLPEQISLELTETAADIDPEIVDRNVKKLHDMGIRFALDDYGTGYSNIRRVVSLPIDQVKLDQSFVEKIDDPHMWIVIKDTISMFKEMGKEVLIEGVESEEVAKRFLELPCDLLQGCEYIQGFFFCKPLPGDEFLAFIQDHLKSNSDN